MHIRDILRPGRSSLSFEFFPPRTEESREKLWEALKEFKAMAPDFVSVTYGAGGSTRELTQDLVRRLQRSASLDPIPHLTCVGHSAREIGGILENYAGEGVSNLLALKGDLPRDAGTDRGDFKQAADLVRTIREFANHPDPRGFGIGVAGFPEGHPGTPNRLREMDYLKAKVDAGADYICTQLFFDNRDFYDFRERCELAGIRVPIIAGIMPVTSQSGLNRMAELAGGARFPSRLLGALQKVENDEEALRQVGIDYAREQCGDLLRQQVAGLHLYTLNQLTAAREIFLSLGLGAPTAV